VLYFIFITNLVAAYANGFLYTARERRTPFKREHMSNSFVVTNCFYDDPSGDPNPLCYVTGIVNGLNVPLAPAFFRYLMAADAADQMQAALTAVMFNYYADVYRSQLAPIPDLIPVPTFPGSDAVATHSEGVYPVAPVVVSEALIAPWTA
jgi:hypothetical protein